MAPDVGTVARTYNRKVEMNAMKRILATSVIGALMLTAPLAFALDKVAVDSPAKEPAKSVVAPEVKKPEAVKTVTAPAKSEAVKANATDEKAAKDMSSVNATKAPADTKAPEATKATRDPANTKAAADSKTAEKDVKHGIAAEAKKTTEAKPLSTSKAPETQVKAN
jgi:hypothetical protein